jgi:hypothetical protein
MLSAREMRMWAIGSIVLLWVEFGWIIAGQLSWAQRGRQLRWHTS